MLEGILKMDYMCPVCAYPDLPTPPENFSICPSCGTEFGFDDSATSHKELRLRWIRARAPWFNDMVPKPWKWNPWQQLLKGGRDFASDIPFRIVDISNPAANVREQKQPKIKPYGVHESQYVAETV